jgi:hypothetical protein
MGVIWVHKDWKIYRNQIGLCWTEYIFVNIWLINTDNNMIGFDGIPIEINS